MLGPLQLLAIQFDDVEHFSGEIMRALRDLRKKGLVRVIDILFVAKDSHNELTTFTHSDLSDAEMAESAQPHFAQSSSVTSLLTAC